MSGTSSPSARDNLRRAWVPPTPEQISLLLPQYQISALLGRGGMGAVYQGIQINLDRPVAIKILPREVEGDEDQTGFAERFKNEARSMARLSHPGIVKVFDFGQTDDGMLFIVMEFIDGTDVSRMMSQQGRLPVAHALAITAYVCDALQYAHDRGVIHRDIKPANIMVGNDGVVKVADFGLARMSLAGESGLTRSGMAMGTLHYMAPEALMLGSAVDHRADVYAVGVMLFFMLTGKLPQGMFTPPSQQVPGLDPRFDEIVVKALRDDREIRYQSAAELRRDLDAILTRPVARVKTEDAQTQVSVPTQVSARRPAPLVSAPEPQRTRTPSLISALPWLTLAVIAGLSGWLMLKHPKGDAVTPPQAESSIPAAADATKTAATPPPASANPAPSITSTTTTASTPTKIPPAKPATTSTSVASNTAPPVAQATNAKTVASPPPAGPSSGKSLAAASMPQLSSGPITWTDTQGRIITASYKGMQKNEVLLDVAGRVLPVALSKLSVASQKQARDYESQMAVAAAVTQDAPAATAATPFSNSLGMKFVPVPGTKVLFCVHETRWRDFAAHPAASAGTITAWKNQTHYGFNVASRKEDHPVVLVSWDEAEAFCQWLSQKENKTYRLPTDKEWDMAVGTAEFPWGSQWPPPQDAGNYNDESRKANLTYPAKNEIFLEGVDDGYPTTAPVMSFKPNTLGLYDIGGNVWEWTDDWYDNTLKERVLRGGAWVNHERKCMASSHRHRFVPSSRNSYHGFRVVLDLAQAR